MLIIAGGGSYYFAKRSVNSDRAERAELEEMRRQQRERLRAQEYASRSAPVTGPANAKRKDGTEGDPAPVTSAHDEMAARGRYESAEPFRSRKGDRFS